jgi:hypothetical protein
MTIDDLIGPQAGFSIVNLQSAIVNFLSLCLGVSVVKKDFCGVMNITDPRYIPA